MNITEESLWPKHQYTFRSVYEDVSVGTVFFCSNKLYDFAFFFFDKDINIYASIHRSMCVTQFNK